MPRVGVAQRVSSLRPPPKFTSNFLCDSFRVLGHPFPILTMRLEIVEGNDTLAVALIKFQIS
jgi:hypothetical protein